MMTRASNKADGIAYSWHDMPLEFSSPKGNLKNYYSANGTKLKTVVESAGGGDVSTIHYFSGIEYKNEEPHTAYWSDGRANFAESEPQHEYYIKDHLGNTRVRFVDKKDPETGEADGIITYDPSDPENDEVLSTHQYYPFDDRLIIATAIKKVIRNHFLRREPKTLLRVGGWDTPNVDSNGNSLLPTDGETRYTYNGKEFQSELGLDLHYYGFRVYDPAIGRFTSVDPIAEKFAFVSGFNYAENEPIRNTDLHGLQKDDALDKFVDDFKRDGFKSAVSNLFGGLFTGSSNEKVESLSSIHNISNTGSEMASDVKQNLQEAKSDFGSGLIQYGEAAQEVGGDAVLGSAVMAATPASPASPVVATAGGITSTIGTGMVLVGDILEDGELSQRTAVNTVVSIATGSVGNKVKQAANNTSILGSKGNSPVNNVIKSSIDVIKLKTEGELKIDQ